LVVEKTVEKKRKLRLKATEKLEKEREIYRERLNKR
jgi:hypothetical protein